MKRKLITLLLAAMLVLSLAACGGGGSSTASDSDSDTIEVASDSSGDSASAVEAPTVEEQVIFDQDGVVVTVTGLTLGDSFLSFGPALQLLVENNNPATVMVQARDASINGIMVDPMMSVDVATGKKANTELTFFSSYLEQAGIEQIKDIEFKLNIADADTWNDIAKSDVISISTSVDASYVQAYDDSGSVMLDQDGIKIVAKKLDDETSFWGADIYLYIANDSGQDVTIQARECSINGFMIDPLFSTDVLNGKKAFSELTFLESDLEANGIDKIETLELSFHVFNKDTWDTIFDSDTITVNF